MSNVLIPGSTDVTVGFKRSPFCDYLSIDGLRVTFSFGGTDWSAAPDMCKWIAPKDAVVCMLTVAVGDISFTQGNPLGSRFVPDSANTYPLVIGVYDESDNLVQDITATNQNTNQCGVQALANNTSVAFSPASGTPANNEFLSCSYINFVRKFGGGIFVREGYSIGHPLTANLSSATNAFFIVSGYFRG